MAWLYILYSKSVNKYYVGITTEEPEKRLKKHNIKYYENQYTSIADDWEIKLSILCSDIKVARKMELYVKRMKSRKFIEKLIENEIEMAKFIKMHKEIS
jgi:putative endonuclease